MSDNVGYTPGIGSTIAADDISGVLHQRVKLEIGADGIATDVSSANPMPVVDANYSDYVNLLTRIVNVLNSPQGYDKTQARMRGTVLVETGSIISTLDSLTVLRTIGGFVDPGQLLTRGSNFTAWATCVRSRIT